MKQVKLTIGNILYSIRLNLTNNITFKEIVFKSTINDIGDETDIFNDFDFIDERPI